MSQRNQYWRNCIDYIILKKNFDFKVSLGQCGRDRGCEIVYTYADEMQADGLTTTTTVTLFFNQVDISVIARCYGGGVTQVQPDSRSCGVPRLSRLVIEWNRTQKYRS